jgi:hypothetical protein
MIVVIPANPNNPTTTPINNLSLFSDIKGINNICLN